MFLEHTINAAAQKKVLAKYAIGQNQRRCKGRSIKLKHLTYSEDKVRIKYWMCFSAVHPFLWIPVAVVHFENFRES